MTSCDAERPRCSGRATALIVVLVAVLVALNVCGRYHAGRAGDMLGFEAAVGVAGVALMPLLLRRPVIGALALAALAALSPAATPPSTVGTLYVAQSRRLPAALGVAAAGVAAHAIQGWWRPPSGLSYAWWLLLVVVGHAALVAVGALVQARRALVASLRERARRAEAEQGRRVAEARAAERTRIAREMHDVLAHRLSLVATYAGALEYRLDAPPEQIAHAAGVVRAGVHQALDELRQVIGVLRDDPHGTRDDDHDADHPQPVLTDLPRLIDESRGAGAQVLLDDRVAEPAAVPGGAGRTAYRIVQEALTNARKHAAGQPVRIALDGGPGSGLVVDIRNPLAPAGPSIAPGSGTGLVGLTERVQLAGGRLDHEVTPAGEFRLRALLPWPA
ncbi:sensor histidine kinase [Pseudonocardia sp. K10HN5]|uniref:histidine kinase n=1 Tax=Pseudonocardia acidicola TaxID=2724939 RepID=A0ABX1SB51_9PSEU|nr:histidine kinase [Pseudonocardia acidicola]NMH98325.1 sensor histidine kinase [Pseudonocardia acidicola]